MTQISLYYNSAARLACDCVLPAQVILCVPVSLIAPRESAPSYQFNTIEASITARVVINDCGGSYNRYTISYDDTQLVGQVPLRADQIQGVVCRGCLTTWVEDVAGDNVTVSDNGDGTYTLIDQHGNQYPFSSAGGGLLACDYSASQYGGLTQQAIVDALAAIVLDGVAGATLYLTCGTWAITNSQAFPANVNVVVKEGATLDISAGQTVTFNGPFDAPSGQVFSGLGAVVFNGQSVVASNAAWFGTDGTAIQKAINSFRLVTVPNGSYLVSSEIQVLNDFQKISFEDVVLNANANGITLIRWSASDGVVTGPLKLAGNTFNNISALRVAPVNEAGVVTRTALDRNSFSDISIDSVTDGVVLSEGPYVAPSNSSCAHNKFYNITAENCLRSFWIKDGPNIGCAGCNQNAFYGCVADQGNLGFQVVNGSQNNFVSCVARNIATGTSPSVSPTGAAVLEQNAYGVPNAFNTFVGVQTDNNTTDFFNDSPTTNVFGSKFTVSTLNTLPKIQFADSLAVNAINFEDAFILQDTGAVTGNILGFNFHRDIALHNNKEMYDYNYYWQNYPLALGLLTNVAVVNSIKSVYRRVNNVVEFNAQFRFQATVAGTPIGIVLPLAPLNSLYVSGAYPFRFPLVANDGVSDLFVKGRFTATSIEVSKLTGNWDTTGANNNIWLEVRYHV